MANKKTKTNQLSGKETQKVVAAKTSQQKHSPNKLAAFVNERRAATVREIQGVVTELNTKSKVLSESKNQVGAALYAAARLEKLNKLVDRHAALHFITEASLADNASVAKFEAVKKAVGVLLAANAANGGNEINRWLKNELQIGVVASALDKLKMSFDHPSKQFAPKGDPLASRRAPTATAATRGMGGRTTAFFEQVAHIEDPDQLLNIVAERLADAMKFFEAYEKLFGDDAMVEKLKTTAAGPAKSGIFSKIGNALTGKTTRGALVKSAFKGVPNFNAEKFGLELTDDVIANNVRAEAQVFNILGDIPEFFAASKSKLNKSIGQSLSGFLTGYGQHSGVFSNPAAAR
jgi:hypothetical protein